MKTSKSFQTAWNTLQIPGDPRKIQIEAINSIFDRTDTLVIVPTSFGKSAIYQVPALIASAKHKWTLAIEPTLSLIADQVERLQGLGISAEMLTSRNQEKHDSILCELQESKITLLYVTPERLKCDDFLHVVECNPPSLLVVDEAHCVLDWGFTFRTAYLCIQHFIECLNHRPVIAAFTATAPPEYQNTICNFLGMKKPDIYIGGLERNNITLLKEDCSNLEFKQRLARVNSNIKKYRKNGRVVVYCGSRANVDKVANYLSKKFPGEVVKCHAFMDSKKREKHEINFIKGSKPIIVATTAFGMGIDAPNIRLVIHFNLPLSAIDYYQQIGRAGRDGKKSHAMLLYHPDDIELGRYIIKQGTYSEQVQSWLDDRLDEMSSIAKSDKCPMQQLLKALGEDHPTTCRHCTNCQKARR